MSSLGQAKGFFRMPLPKPSKTNVKRIVRISLWSVRPGEISLINILEIIPISKGTKGMFLILILLFWLRLWLKLRLRNAN